MKFLRLQGIIRKPVILIYVVLFAIGIAIPILSLAFPDRFASNQQELREVLAPYGSWAPVVLVGLSILPVVITPLNHSVFGIAAGYIFGVWEGFLINWIAKVIGTLISFYIARHLGRRLVQRFVDPSTIEKYDAIFSRSTIIWFLIYSVPFFGPDELPFLAGLSSIRAVVFLPLALLAHVNKSLFLAYLGSGMSLDDPVFIVVTTVAIISGVLLLLFQFKRSDGYPKSG